MVAEVLNKAGLEHLGGSGDDSIGSVRFYEPHPGGDGSTSTCLATTQFHNRPIDPQHAGQSLSVGNEERPLSGCSESEAVGDRNPTRPSGGILEARFVQGLKGGLHSKQRTRVHVTNRGRGDRRMRPVCRRNASGELSAIRSHRIAARQTP